MSVFYSIDWIYSYQQTKCLGIIFHLKLNKYIMYLQYHMLTIFKTELC